MKNEQYWIVIIITEILIHVGTIARIDKLNNWLNNALNSTPHDKPDIFIILVDAKKDSIIKRLNGKR